ncbi:MAG: hypothetical protein AAFR79_19900 [Pseudomonadota bacterium]
MDWKTLATLVSVGVSVASAYWANEARNAAHDLSERKFGSETTLTLLDSVYRQITVPGNSEDNRYTREMACRFVNVLGIAEQDARPEGPHLVATFVRDVESAGLWSTNCSLMLSEALVAAEEPLIVPLDPIPEASVEGTDPVTAVDPPPEEAVVVLPVLGDWLAVIASYRATPGGCSLAEADVQEFGALLSGLGFENLRVEIARTLASNYYAVAVDAGADRELALSVSEAMRAVSGRSGDKKTGRDSFVHENQNWAVDPACPAQREIEP